MSISPCRRGSTAGEEEDLQVEEADLEVEEANLEVEEADRPEAKKMPNSSESRHQAEQLLGDGVPKQGMEKKTAGGGRRHDAQMLASGLSRGGW